MGVLTILPTAATPIERVLSSFDRRELEGFIAVAIGLLDLADGDPELEENGDERDGGGALEEDAGLSTPFAYLGEHEDDEDDDPAEKEPDRETELYL